MWEILHGLGLTFEVVKAIFENEKKVMLIKMNT